MEEGSDRLEWYWAHTLRSASTKIFWPFVSYNHYMSTLTITSATVISQGVPLGKGIIPLVSSFPRHRLGNPSTMPTPTQDSNVKFYSFCLLQRFLRWKTYSCACICKWKLGLYWDQGGGRCDFLRCWFNVPFLKKIMISDI